MEARRPGHRKGDLAMAVLLALGTLLVVGGGLVVTCAARRTPSEGSTGAHGLVLGLGASLVVWGAIAVVVWALLGR